MASTTRAAMRLPTSSIAFKATSRRQFATSSLSFLARARPSSRILLDKSKLQQNLSRTYADIAPAKKPRRFRFFRFLWRLTYLSAIGGTAYLAYGVYEQKHPDDQFEPDPTKKNLVILGLYIQLPLYILSADFCVNRDWVGCCVSS
jgi:NADH:ubiquinone reductase (non-electrogenic)